MSIIGHFVKSGDEYRGEIVTLLLKSQGVRIIPVAERVGENGPAFRVVIGTAEVGAAWSRKSEAGKDYLSISLDDPSFQAPVHCALVEKEGGGAHSLIWSRSRREAG
jgi:uncharacterized protein (DUF736 family)